MHRNKSFLCFLILTLTAGSPAAYSQEKVPDSGVVSKSGKAIGYRVGGGSTKGDLKGTDLMPEATGEIKVAAKAITTNIDVKIKEMTQPSKLGAEFLTYVLWVVTPDGRPGNTGEILINENGEGKLNATTPRHMCAMIVTAEPYLAVRPPTEVGILQN